MYIYLYILTHTCTHTHVYVYIHTRNQHTGSGAEFCRENMLHGPTMSRTLDLRRQLGRTLNRYVYLDVGQSVSWAHF